MTNEILIRNLHYYTNIAYEKGKKDGVELAQKEFLHSIEDFYIKSFKSLPSGKYGNRIVEMNILKELKQSLNSHGFSNNKPVVSPDTLRGKGSGK